MKIPLPMIRWKEGCRYGKPFTVLVPSMHGPWYPSAKRTVYCESQNEVKELQREINAIQGIR